MVSPKIAVVILVLLFLLWSADHRKPLHEDHETELAIGLAKESLKILKQSHYGAFNTTSNDWLNLTGLRQSDGYAWDLLPKVQDRAKLLLDVSLDEADSMSFRNASVPFDDVGSPKTRG